VAAPATSRHGDVQNTARQSQHSPETGGCAMADRRTRPASQRRRHASAFVAQTIVPNRVHPAMNPVQAASPDPVGDRLRIDSGGEQLLERDGPVLVNRDSGDHEIGMDAFLRHSRNKASIARTAPGVPSLAGYPDRCPTQPGLRGASPSPPVVTRTIPHRADRRRAQSPRVPGPLLISPCRFL
jgi:hypothetical protein